MAGIERGRAVVGRRQPELGVAGLLLQFRFERNREAETLYLSGELDVASPAALERTVDSALDRQGGVSPRRQRSHIQGLNRSRGIVASA